MRPYELEKRICREQQQDKQFHFEQKNRVAFQRQVLRHTAQPFALPKSANPPPMAIMLADAKNAVPCRRLEMIWLSKITLHDTGG